MDDYLSIARIKLSDFGIVQCKAGHHLCKPCWRKLQPRICPNCCVDMSEPVPLRVLEDEVKGYPADCKWGGCCSVGLTLGTKMEHEGACSQKLLPCGCGFSGTISALIEHRKQCINYHLIPLNHEVSQLRRDNQILKNQLIVDRQKYQAEQESMKKDIAEYRRAMLTTNDLDIQNMQAVRRRIHRLEARLATPDPATQAEAATGNQGELMMGVVTSASAPQPRSFLGFRLS